MVTATSWVAGKSAIQFCSLLLTTEAAFSIRIASTTSSCARRLQRHMKITTGPKTPSSWSVTVETLFPELTGLIPMQRLSAKSSKTLFTVIRPSARPLCSTADKRVVKEVYYPKYSPSRPFYEEFRHSNGGYGGLLSATFHSRDKAITFFDTVEYAKGPSLGTNFTLWSGLLPGLLSDVLTIRSSPYVILAHYHELDWVSNCTFSVRQF